MSELESMKVIDLQSECKKRGLDYRGKKAELVERLKKAIEKDGSICEDTEMRETEQEGNEEKISEEPLENSQEEQKTCHTESVTDDVIMDNSDRVITTEVDISYYESDEVIDASIPENGDISLDRTEVDADIENDDIIQQENGGNEEEGSKDEEVKAKSDSSERKRKHSKSRSRSRHRSHRSHSKRARDAEIVVPELDKYEVDSTHVVLDHYNSDLNLILAKDCLSAQCMTDEGFCFTWAGARATYGLVSGKVAYEVKFVEVIKPIQLSKGEVEPYGLRIGWSIDSKDYMLGESSKSYGYTNKGKKATENNFEDYGQPFDINDIVSSYIDFESDKDTVVISFAKNGELLGPAFNINREELDGSVLYPHILAKNCKYEVNFGQRPDSWSSIEDDFTLINNVEIDDRIQGPLGANEKKDCEVVMMIGLPASGKTFYAHKLLNEKPEKRYSIISTKVVLDHMKIDGRPRESEAPSRFNVYHDRASRCVNRLIEIAPRKARNYIIDQSNVYKAVQQRRMKPFEGFNRKAVFILPTEEEYKERIEKSKSAGEKEVSAGSLGDMKAALSIPEVGEIFSEVEFSDLSGEAAKELVSKYNKDGMIHRRPRRTRRPLHRRPMRRFREERYRRGPRSPRNQFGRTSLRRERYREMSRFDYERHAIAHSSRSRMERRERRYPEYYDRRPRDYPPLPHRFDDKSYELQYARSLERRTPRQRESYPPKVSSSRYYSGAGNSSWASWDSQHYPYESSSTTSYPSQYYGSGWSSQWSSSQSWK